MAKELFRLVSENSVNVVELALPQSLDSEEFDRLNESLEKVFTSQSGDRWVMDLSGLSYMGSSALGLMVNVRQRIKGAGGRLVLCGLSPRLLEIFHTCCMEKLFTIAGTREEAMRKC